MNFNGTAHWSQSGYVVYDLTDFFYYDGYENIRGGSYFPSWTSTSGITMQFTGSYQAALAGFQIQNNRDLLIFRFQRADNSTIASQGFSAAYGFGNPARITAPSTGDPYTPFSVNADLLDPMFVPPVTYSWTDGGNPLVYTSDYFEFPGSEPGINHDFEVTISDSEGRSATTTVHIHTRTCYAPCDES
ncbi:MAG: hypothetical protein ABR582_17025 [Gemmatimonadaceae bacterium]